MGEHEPNFKNFKQRGEWVEMLFMARASREGLQVSKPYGESAAYDFIVESGSLCSRIQVKSTRARTHNGFVCNLRCSASRTYDLGSFHFAAVHVIPLEVWFIPAAHKSRHIPQARKAKFKVLRIRRSLALAEASRAELV